jgi:heme-degrading monooxygenase HmoA
MLMRIIHGKLKPGSWDAYEAAYKEAVAQAGEIPGLRARWLMRDVDDPDSGYTLSLWESEAALRRYESSKLLQTTFLPKLQPYFSGDYSIKHCEVRVAGDSK